MKKKINKEFKQELGRKIIHIFLGTLFLFLIYFNILTLSSIIIIFLISLFLAILSKKYKIYVLHIFLEKFERKKDMNFPGKGFVFFILGILLTVLFFDKEISLAAIAILTYTDSFASLIGRTFGKRHILNSEKTLEGSLAGFIMGLISASFFIDFKYAVVAAFFGTVSEVIELNIFDNPLDDNIIVPVIAAFSIVLAKFFGF